MAGEANIWNPRTLIAISGDTKSVEERITATLNQSLFILTEFVYVVGTGALEVHKNGLLLAKGLDWVEQTPTTFSLTTPTLQGDTIVASGATAITGDVDVRDTDIYVSNYQAIRDYAGTEITLYSQGKLLATDAGQGFFHKVTGFAPAYWVDNNYNIIVPTGGDGSVAWIDTTIPFISVANLLLFPIGVGEEVTTLGYTTANDGGAADYIVVVGSTGTDDGGSYHDMNNGNQLELRVVDSIVKVKQFGATGVAGVDQTTALQNSLVFGQTLNTDKAFTWLIPHGTFEATHLSVDRSLPNRNIVLKGDATVSDSSGSILKLTDTTQSTGFDWDGGMIAYNLTFDFNDARAVGALGDPRWCIDIRNVDNADSSADIDVEFINCIIKNTHRGIKLFGRGFKYEGGSFISSGGAASEGCLLDLDFPNPLEPGTGSDQTIVTGMRAYRILGTRIHGCTGHLIRNKGYNANNVYQMQVSNLYCDTAMGLIKGAAVNLEVNGGTWLSTPSIFIWVEDTFDMRNVSLNSPMLLGMPEANIGQSLFGGGTVSDADVLANAQGTILFVSGSAGVVENFTHTGGVVSDVAGDAYSFVKAVDGLTVTGVCFNNMMKDNKTAGTTRHVFNMGGTSSKNIAIKNNINKNLTMTQTGEFVADADSVTAYSIEDNFLSGSVFETFSRPKDTGFGSDQSSVFCGEYTGLGGDTTITKNVASRYVKCAIVSQTSGAGIGSTWAVKDGDNPTDVRLNGQQLDCRQLANVINETYSFMLFF